jgi:hypothetical protein
MVPAIEGGRVPANESLHELGETTGARTHQQVNVVGHQRPGIHGGSCVLDEVPQAVDESLAVLVIDEEFPAFEAPENGVVQRPGVVKSRAAWHPQ